MACVEKGLAHELAPLAFGSESHRALHPFLKMPAMSHDGVELYETVAILSYVDAIGDGPALQPARPIERAQMLQWISVANSYLYADLVAALLDSSPTRGDQRIVADVDLLDRRLGEAPFLAGPSLSLADLIVAPMIGFAYERTGFDLGARPGLARWWRTVSDRASFRETAA